ncbi:MAG: hypothetical protein K0Q50_211 [Vampirovibrio sp.]|jgi:hypothetical protein|nr:hypothetical protein [Vampirovibrio sp.]
MKTENLSWVEAIRAYSDGERVVDMFGYQYWLDGETPMFKHPSSPPHPFSLSAELFRQEAGPFSIVKPEPKKLSFDEAIEMLRRGKAPKIHWPLENLEGADIDARRPYAVDLCHLDLAERRGWPITVAE